MTRAWESLRNGLSLAWLLAKAGAGSVGSHWALAIVSLLVAAGVWVIVQDIENPRIEGIVPPPEEAAIAVVGVNIPDGYLMREAPTVRVRVEAREETLAQLRASDFEATVDLLDVTPDQPTFVQVTVTSRRDDVDVVTVEPREVQVTLVEAAEKTIQVTINRTGSLPEGYEEISVDSDPAFVVVSGLQDLVDRVATVELDVNLSNVRTTPTYVVEGNLVARSASGNTVLARLSQSRAQATFRIEQVFQTRTLPLRATVSGDPALGFRVVSAAVEPQLVTVTGTPAVLDSLGDFVRVSEVSVAGARSDVVQSAEIIVPANVVADRTTVTVRVTLAAQTCTGADPPPPPCGTLTFFVAPQFTEVPPGLAVLGGSYSVEVRVSANLDRLATLSGGDFQALVSLAGGTAGAANYDAIVTAPPGVRVDGVTAIRVTLVGN